MYVCSGASSLGVFRSIASSAQESNHMIKHPPEQETKKGCMVDRNWYVPTEDLESRCLVWVGLTGGGTAIWRVSWASTQLFPATDGRVGRMRRGNMACLSTYVLKYVCNHQESPAWRRAACCKVMHTVGMSCRDEGHQYGWLVDVFTGILHWYITGQTLVFFFCFLP